MTIKNILLVGKTGNSKSTLANVLVNKKETIF
jgi:Flp pilus assembly CpaF family ATPase